MLRTTYSSIKEIHLSFNKQINDGCMKSFGEYVQDNEYLERLDISWIETI